MKRVVNVIYINFSKTSNAASQYSCIHIRISHSGWAGKKSDILYRETGTKWNSAAPQKAVMETLLFNISISDTDRLHARWFADSTK